MTVAMQRDGLRFTRRHLLLGTCGLLLAGCGERAAGGEDAPASNLALNYPDSDRFVDPRWLRDNLNDPALRLLDLSELPVYRGGHIPGALHVWWQDTIEIHNPVYGMLVNAGGRAELVRDAGITADSIVVCYDDRGGVHAARLAWMLRYMGFRGARLLNGGRQGWIAHGGDLTRDEPDAPEGELDDIFDESTNATADDVAARLEEDGLVILDTRTRAERGETWRGRLREGAIPGSIWLPRDRFITGNPPSVIDASRLREQLGDAGIDLNATAEFIVYGLHGTLAALPALTLVALEDFHVRVYDGSWAEWGLREDLPAEPLEP
ncbi:MAG: sulfurtransferase [Chloroflexota bacterium]